MKLSTFMEKFKCEWLNHIKATISIRLTKVPVTIAYDRELRAFKSEVNKKLTPTLSTTTPTRRHIQEVSRGQVHFGRGGRGGGCGKGRGYQGGRGQGNGGGSPYKTCPDSKLITLQNGNQIEYHASFNFPGTIFSQMKQHDIEMLKKERQEYKDRRNQVGYKRNIQYLQQENKELRSVTGSRPPEDLSLVQTTAMSQITNGTMMGRRNKKQAQKRN